MIAAGAMLARRCRCAALSLAAFALVVAPSVAVAAACPDPSTVSAARLLEFKTMMMVVGLRCKSVGVMMADHNDDMAAMRSTMFEEANRRVRRYMAEADRPVPLVAPADPPAEAAPAAAAALPRANTPARAR
ncbi:MAG: hypothetical protein K2X68_06260, partial [Novosphingobium sp.]|nr:hypothetical protein [Novosphingobium sp.]